MNNKPLITIDKFTGMSGDGGMFWVDGFSPRKENGVQMLTSSYVALEVLNNATANFTDINNINSIISLGTLRDSWKNDSFNLFIDGLCNVYTKPRFNTLYSGKVLSSYGVDHHSNYNDILSLPSGNVLVASGRYASLIIRGLIKTGSSTTKIIDSAGRNFETLGLSTSAPNNKVTNMRTGVSYTITAITNANATKDALEFTASGSNTNNANDEFMAFVGAKFDLSTGQPTYFGNLGLNNWSRSVQQYGDQFLIANGNYLAIVSADETTIDQTYKQLPANYQCLDFSINQTQILVSAVSLNGSSSLLLWDGSTDGWQSVLDIDSTVFSIAPYSSGWVFILNNKLVFTDGHNIKDISNCVDTEEIVSQSIKPLKNNCIGVLNNKVFVCTNNQNYNRLRPGIYVYDFANGWSFLPTLLKNKQSEIVKCININSGATNNYGVEPSIDVGNEYSLNTIRCGSNLIPYTYKSFIYYIDLKQITNIKEVYLNMSNDLTRFLEEGQSIDIEVNVGDGRDGIFGYAQATAVTTTTVAVNGVNYPGTVGDEITATREFFCAIRGERSFIRSIANPGTVNEVWTVSPAFSANNNDTTNFLVTKVKQCERKTVAISDLLEPIRFNVDGFYSSKMFIEVVIHGKTNSFMPSITSIQLN